MLKRKKIAIVCPEYPPITGGIALYIDKLVKYLLPFYDVDIITSTLRAYQNIEKSNKGINVYYCIDNWKLAGFRKLNSIINSKRYDFINIQYMPHFYGYKGVNLSLPFFLMYWRIKNKNISVLFHEIALPLSLKNIKQAPFALLNRLTYFIIVYTSRKVGLSASKWTESLKRYFFYFKNKFVTIPVFSNLERKDLSCDEKARIRSSLGISESDAVLFFLGYLHPSKLFNFILDALDYLLKKRYKVRLLCAGYQTEDIPSIVNNGYSHIKDKIIAIGECSENQLEKYLNVVDIYLCPYADGLSERRTSAMTGLQFRIPIVTTSGINTNRDFLKENGGAFILAKNKKQFIKEVEYLMKNTAQRKNIGDKGHEFYHNNFSADKVAGIYKKHLFVD